MSEVIQSCVFERHVLCGRSGAKYSTLGDVADEFDCGVIFCCRVTNRDNRVVQVSVNNHQTIRMVRRDDT